MKKRVAFFIAALILAASLAACAGPDGAQGNADGLNHEETDSLSSQTYMPEVRWGGHSYIFEGAETIPEDMIGEKLGEVTFRMEGSGKGPGYQLQDGDAMFLDPGTPLHEMKDSEDIAAYVNGEWQRYKKFTGN